LRVPFILPFTRVHVGPLNFVEAPIRVRKNKTPPDAGLVMTLCGELSERALRGGDMGAIPVALQA